MATTLPWSRLKEAEHNISLLNDSADLSLSLVNGVTGEALICGGIWDNVAKKYTSVGKGNRTLKLTEPQWKLVQECRAALYNDDLLAQGKPPIQEIILHGGRRSGKSVGGKGGAALVALAKPNARIWVIGLRKRHGDKIIQGLKRLLPTRYWTHDKVDNTLRLINGSTITAKSAVNYDSDRGDSLDLLILDEAAFMPEAVHDALVSALADRNGFCLSLSSPNMFNWFFRLAEKSQSSDPIVRQTVRTIQSTASDNIFVKHLAKRMEFSKHTLSADAYKQEVLGEFLNRGGIVLPQFDKSIHVLERFNLGKRDITEQLTAYVFGKRAKYIVGVDYNINPTAGVICKFDDRGHVWYIAELDTHQGTEQWGKELYNLIQKLSGGGDPYDQTIIVGDASGEYQDPRKGPDPSAHVLREQGWTVHRPTLKRRNPSRRSRLEVMRSLCMNAASEVRMWVDPSCENLIEVLREHPLNTVGLPDKSYKGNHKYDAASYPVYRIWGSKQAEGFYKFKLIEHYVVDLEDTE